MDSPQDFDFDPVSFITVGTQGPPGQRSFFLQAAQGARRLCLAIEKEQAIALGAGLERLLADFARKSPERMADLSPSTGNLNLLQPVEPAFRVGSLGLGLDEDQLRVLLVARELSPEDEPARAARMVMEAEQALALQRHIPVVVEAGRPDCPACGEPMDPEGHRCPRRNGHGRIDDD
jgi:uncharacterized repeat protein (TIGR03847 family)